MVTPAHRATWEAKWLQAGPEADVPAVFAMLNRHFAHGWQVVIVDALTPPAVEAALALAGFTAEVTVVEMLADSIVRRNDVPPVTIKPVDDAQWNRLAALVDADHREGKRTGKVDPAVAAGLLDGMRRRSGPCRYWLLTDAGADLGYGMTAICPNGLGLIEELFTLPQHRGRGLMSAFIGNAASRLRAEGCDAVFLDAHVDDTPKHLYARLGFRPVALTRTWVRHQG